MTIQRYCDMHFHPGLVPREEGDWVEYGDHCAILADALAREAAERLRGDVAVADANDAERREAALREELATAKRNEHNSEVSYKAAIERQEELRNELDRIKTISDNNFSIATDRYFALKAAEQRNAELVEMLRMAWGSDDVSAADCRRIDAACAKPTESGASE